MTYLSSLRRVACAGALLLWLCVWATCAHAATFNLSATGSTSGVSSYNTATQGTGTVQTVQTGSDTFALSSGLHVSRYNRDDFYFTLSDSHSLQKGDVFTVGGSAPSASVSQSDWTPTPFAGSIHFQAADWDGVSGQITITELTATSITLRFDDVMLDFVLLGSHNIFTLNGTITSALSEPTATATPNPTATPLPTATPKPTTTATPKPTATATSLPVLSVDSPSVKEGNGGTGVTPSQLKFTLTLSRASSQSVGVIVQSANASSDSATSGSDYVPLGKTRVTFAPGQTKQSVTLSILGDTTYEADEHVALISSSPVGATLSQTVAQGTIINDDPMPALSINDVSLKEGNSGYSRAIFTVSLSNSSGRAISVGYKTNSYGPGVALGGTTTTPDVDYLSASGTLTFAPGQTSQTIVVYIKGDTIVEGDEKFLVQLSAPVNARLVKSTGTGTILNDDSSPPADSPRASPSSSSS